MVAVARAEQDIEGNAGALSGASGAWRRHAEAWDWKDRADAWDRYQLKLERDQFEADRRESQRKRRQALEEMFSQMLTALPSIDFTAVARPGEFVYSMKLVMQELRTEYGDDRKVEQDRPLTILNFTVEAGPDQSHRMEEFERIIAEQDATRAEADKR
jgi:hypothetical protein